MKKTLISLAAAATLAIGLSATANANPSFGFGFSIGSSGQPHFGVSVYDPGYGYHPDYYGYHQGYYGAGYGDYNSDCGFTWVSGWHRVHHHMVFGPHKVWSCE